MRGVVVGGSTVPTIATPINNCVMKNVRNLSYLRGLKLAHTISDQSEFTVSILVGADNY